MNTNYAWSNCSEHINMVGFSKFSTKYFILIQRKRYFYVCLIIFQHKYLCGGGAVAASAELCILFTGQWSRQDTEIIHRNMDKLKDENFMEAVPRDIRIMVKVSERSICDIRFYGFSGAISGNIFLNRFFLCVCLWG